LSLGIRLPVLLYRFLEAAGFAAQAARGLAVIAAINTLLNGVTSVTNWIRIRGRV
jgi:hypothetical protein